MSSFPAFFLGFASGAFIVSILLRDRSLERKPGDPTQADIQRAHEAAAWATTQQRTGLND